MSVSVSLDDLQAAGFPMGGESSVAVDFVDTERLAVTPAIDLLADDAEAWWRLQSGRLPGGEEPAEMAASRLRSAIREAFEARIAGRAAPASAVEELNSFAASVPSSPRLVSGPQGFSAETRWHPEHGGNAKLAAVAGDAMALLADPVRAAQLRHCAGSECSMIFLAENSRRVWCTANLCGNRARVARHQRRRQRDDRS